MPDALFISNLFDFILTILELTLKVHSFSLSSPKKYCCKRTASGPHQPPQGHTFTRRMFRSTRWFICHMLETEFMPLRLKARSDRARRCASTRPIKLMLKIGSIHTERVDARQLICIIDGSLFVQ